MNGDGAVTQADFHVWQTNFIEWKKRAKKLQAQLGRTKVLRYRGCGPSGGYNRNR